MTPQIALITVYLCARVCVCVCFCLSHSLKNRFQFYKQTKKNNRKR